MDEPQNISAEERDAFKKALTIHYSGNCRIADAFAQVEPGLIDRYYRRKKRFPREIERIESEARAAAREEISSERLAFESWQLQQSREIQERAIALMQEHGLPRLFQIVLGEPMENLNKETGEVEMVTVYPRDQLQALRLLIDFARDGIMGKGFRPASAAEKKEDDIPLFSPVLGVSTDFKTLSAKRADGTVFTVNVKNDDIVVESEDTVERSDGGPKLLEG